MTIQTKNIEVFVNATLSLATGLGLDTEETLGAIFIIQRRLSKRENVPLLQFLQRIFDATLHVVLPPDSGKEPTANAATEHTYKNNKHDKTQCNHPDCRKDTTPSVPEATKAKGKRNRQNRK